MSSGRLGPRIAMAVAITSIVAGVAGLIITLVLSAFVFDRFDAYGEVEIPGRGTVTLPAGEVTVSFHTLVTGSSGGLPVQPLQMSLLPPDGAPDPVVTENYGSTTTVNNDARVRVWVAQIPTAGSYVVETAGEVNGYINPRLAFGYDSSPGWPAWAFGGLIALGVVELVAALMWLLRAGKRARPVPSPDGLEFGAAPVWTAGAPPAAAYAPTDHAVRIEQLKTLAALRDSGALSHSEYEAEKRRVLET